MALIHRLSSTPTMPVKSEGKFCMQSSDFSSRGNVVDPATRVPYPPSCPARDDVTYGMIIENSLIEMT